MRKLVLGLGSGRCGSYTLHNLLDIQKDFICTHENYLLPWEIEEKKCILKITELLWQDYRNVADTSYSWLNYVPFIIPFVGEVKFICLKRDKEQTVESYFKHKRHPNFMVAKDSVHYLKEHEKTDEHYVGFPRYDLPKKEALAQYWDTYYETANVWEASYPYNFKIFDIDDLNSEEGQKKIFNFIGIPKEDHVYDDERFHAYGSLLLEMQPLEKRIQVFHGTLCQICQEPATYHMVCKTYPRSYYLCDDYVCMEKTIEKMQKSTGIEKYNIRTNKQ